MKRKKVDEDKCIVMELRKLYVVFVLTTPSVSILGKNVKPELPKDMAGYLPAYHSLEDALKDWPNHEIKEFQITTPEVNT
jgi:hypothetical protein